MKITIPKRSTACYGCQKPFEIDQEIISQLTEDYSRHDTCLDCYVPIKATIWRQKFQQKVSIVTVDETDEIAKAWELLGSSKGEEAYILVLYLIRKKIVAKRGKEGLYEHLETGEMVMVEEIDLKNSSIADIHAKLQAKMQ